MAGGGGREGPGMSNGESGGKGDTCLPKNTCQDDVYLNLGDTDGELRG